MSTMRSQTTSSAMDPRTVKWIRIRVIMLACMLVPMFSGLFYRAVSLQIFDGKKLESLARDQYLREVTLPGRRGAIYDRRGAALAASVDVDSIYVDPSELTDLKKDSAALANAIKAEPAKVLATLSASKHFAWVKRRASPGEALAVKALGLPGIGFTKEARRFYPQRELAAHLIGFSGMDGEGLEGVELALDAMLKGKPQSVAGFRDARGRAAIIEGTIPSEELEGSSVTLTIDRAVQYLTEKALADAVTKANAQAGSAVVLDPATGEILALANVPTFNPNEPARYQKQALRNRALSDQFEPGSTFKLFTISGALEEKAVKATSTFYCEKGRYQIGRHAIHDHGGYADLDVGKILQVSSNIGTAKIAEKLGRERLQAYQKAFGFGEKPNTGLSGEAKGQLPFPRADISLATESFGQGVTASAVQIAAGVGAIANGGVLMHPYLVSKVVDPDGEVVLLRGPEKIRQVISRATSQEMLRLMRLVVEKEGTAPLARMDEYEVAGKTGTAQKVDPVTGSYSVDKRTASFVGVVPADAPRLVILVVIDEPKGDVYGGLVAAPAFKEIAQGALAHLGVPPSKPLVAKADGKDRKEPEKVVQESRNPALAGAFAMAEVNATLALSDSGSEEGFIGDDEASEGNATVPNVQGMTARAAVRTLAAANLEPALLGNGKAIGQTPPPGTAVRRGTKVAVRLESRL